MSQLSLLKSIEGFDYIDVEVHGQTLLYLQEITALILQGFPLPPMLQKPLELHKKKQEILLELLGFLYQKVLLLAPELLLQPPLKVQALQLKFPSQEGLLVIIL